MTYYKQTKDAAWTHTPKGTVYVSTFDNYIQPEDESLRKTPMGIDLSLCDGEDLCLFVPLTTIELEAQAQQKLNIGSVVRPEVESAKEGELLPESDGEANISAGCCDHVEWVVRLGILQCANCGKPN